jgi:carbon-monoxide dehydrogenase large subunit
MKRELARKEDYRMLVGAARYIDDIEFDGMRYLGFVRSPWPHAKIMKINIDQARKLTGVELVLTGEDTPAPMPVQVAVQGMREYRYYPLAREKARYVGEAVAAVVIENRAASEDTVESVDVEYELLPTLPNVEKSLEPNGPVINPECGTNVIYEKQIDHGNVDKAFKEAYGTVKLTVRMARQAGVPIETRGIIAKYDPEQVELHVWSPTKNPHATRRQLSRMLNLPETKIHVIVPEMGGGFGVKASIYPEDVVACLASIRTGKPVKWIEDREEDFLASYQGRDQIHNIEAAFDREARILAFKDRFICDIGAPGIINLSPGLRTIPLLTGCYRIPNVKVETIWVATNKTPTGPVRGNGRAEAILAIERTVDLIATKLGLDPAEVRLRNMIQPTDFPYDTHLGSVYDGGDFPAALSKVLGHSGYRKLQREREAARKKGRLVGIGLGCSVEDTGLGPSSQLGRGGFETAYMTVETSGRVTLRSGASPHGQGLETSLSQVCSKELGIPVDQIDVIFGNTDEVPEGTGTYASRSIVMAGSAAAMASRALKMKALDSAANFLGVSTEDINLENGTFHVKSNRQKNVTLRQIADKAYRESSPPLEAHYKFDPPGYTFASGAHLAFVEVDPDTGETSILRYVAADDCGKIVNQMIVDGQVVGGIAHGIGDALFEELTFDENCQPQNTTFLKYQIMAAEEMPDIELVHQETHSKLNPLGVKGAGEGGTIAAVAAIANAVADALAPLDLKVTEIPLTTERVWALLHQQPS